MNLAKVLEFEEGYSSVPYLCSEGFVTIGFGTKLHKSKNMSPGDFPIKVSRAIAFEWLETEVAIKDLRLSNGPMGAIYQRLDSDRQAIILSMSYQLGTSGVLKFKKMWKALALGNKQLAGLEMIDSRWAVQTPERANRHFRVMVGAKLSDVYTH